VVKHADFGHVSGIVTDDDRLANIRRQGRIEVTPGIMQMRVILLP